MIGKELSINSTKKKIFFLSIPIFFSNIAIPLVGIVDTGLMGNLGQTKYLAATSIASTVMTMIIWSFAFLRMGTVGIVAQLYARSDYREIVKTLIRNFLIGFIFALAIIILESNIIELVNNFFTTSSDTKNLINTYISIRVLSVPAEFTIYILIGFYLGIQKTNISSLLVIMMSSLNIIFSSIFVLTFDLNVFGVALGTLLACYITAITFSIITYNYILKKFQIYPSFQKIISFSKIIKLLSINFDIFIRTLFLTFSFFWITFIGSKLGEDILAINTILIQFIILASFFLDAYAYSTEGLIGYAIGKRNKKSFVSIVNNSIQLSLITAIFISIIYLIFFKQVINIITDIDILRYISYKHAIWIILIPPIASLCYQLDGIFIGASQTKEMRNAMIFSVITFIIISIYMTEYFGNHGLWFSIALFMLLRSVTLKFFFNTILKKF